MQRVMAHFYHRAIERRGKVDTFSIVKFRRPTNGTVNTEEHGIPAKIKTDQPWIAEAPVGDWFYSPGFTYDSGMMIRYLIEAVARDGNAALAISLLPDGSLDEGSARMLREVGEWMSVNGNAIYGSRAWKVPGEGEMIAGELKKLPGGKLGKKHAEFAFGPRDICVRACRARARCYGAHHVAWCQSQATGLTHREGHTPGSSRRAPMETKGGCLGNRLSARHAGEYSSRLSRRRLGYIAVKAALIARRRGL
jgi:hypothetical protein